MDISGVGSDALRKIATDSRHRIDIEALQQGIHNDRRDGFTPFLVVGSTGTVDTGAIDDLAALADLCHPRSYGFMWTELTVRWRLAPEIAPRLRGIERADSLAFDFHKWGHVPYDAGFILVREGQLHQQSFESSPAYETLVQKSWSDQPLQPLRYTNYPSGAKDRSGQRLGRQNDSKVVAISRIGRDDVVRACRKRSD